MRAALILAPWFVGLALFFNGMSPVWPWLLVSCAVAFVWTRHGAVALALGVLAVQLIKAVPMDHLWVYYGMVYALIGFIWALFFDKMIAFAAFVIGACFIFLPQDLTEIAFYGGLIGAAYVGPTGGILSGVSRPAGENPSGIFGHRAGQLYRRIRLGRAFQPNNRAPDHGGNTETHQKMNGAQ